MLFFRQIFFFRQILPFITLFGLASPVYAFAEENPQTAEQPQLQCIIPSYTPIVTKVPKVTDDSIRITSKYSSIEKDRVANFNGDVILIDKSQIIKADHSVLIVC